MRWLNQLFSGLFSTRPSSVCPVSRGRSVEKFLVFVEILPREFTDIVIHPFDHVSERRRTLDDVAGYQSVDDAIIDAEFVGLALLGQVKAENLFFFFGETVKFLQCAAMRFCAERSIPYQPTNLCGQVYTEQNGRSDECKTDPLAIVLCKLAKIDDIEKRIPGPQQHTTDDRDRYQITWSQLQKLKKQCGNVRHGGVPFDLLKIR